MNILDLSEQEIIRRNSLDEMRKLGIEPYPAAEYPVNAYSQEIKNNFVDGAETPRQVAIAGRIMSRRIMGKASFIELKDSEGRIQVYISRDDLCPGEDKELYNTVFKKLLDIGDFIGIRGFVFRTQMGEITVHAQELTVLAKSIRPLPIVKMKDGVAYDAFEDPELRRLGGKRRSKRYIHQTEQSVHLHAGIFQLSWISGSRNTHSAIDTRRCGRPSVHHPPQCARHTSIFAYRR